MLKSLIVLFENATEIPIVFRDSVLETLSFLGNLLKVSRCKTYKKGPQVSLKPRVLDCLFVVSIFPLLFKSIDPSSKHPYFILESDSLRSMSRHLLCRLSESLFSNIRSLDPALLELSLTFPHPFKLISVSL